MEEEIIEKLRLFIDENTLRKIIDDTKIKAEIFSLEGASRNKRMAYYEMLIRNTVIGTFSSQKAAIIEACLRDILDIKSQGYNI